MKSGHILALTLAASTVGLIVIGTVWPNRSAAAAPDADFRLMTSSSTPENAVNTLLQQIGRGDWPAAYSSLANKGEFTESEFTRDFTGNSGSLRTYATRYRCHRLDVI